MPYDQHLEERISRSLKVKHVAFQTKKMMGGLCYLVDEKMAVGIMKDFILVRIDPGIYQEALMRSGCRPMDFTGRTMKGFVRVDPIGFDLDADLDAWIGLALEFNPRAKSSKKTISKTQRKKKSGRS